MAPARMTLVALEGVGKRFASGTQALAGVELRIEAGNSSPSSAPPAAASRPCCG
ncbi:hypothetical protein ACFQY5_20710 [Paeniroseomonas aquatica]|uniref:hypothetical protein n=1 Tax=Paeniroseomonas aquatica TaxID=373043 RepID=UPI0036222B52